MKSFSIIARLVAAAMLFWALDSHPYDYYALLRWTVFAVAVAHWFISRKYDRTGWAWYFAILAILFNPVFPVHLKKELWESIDLLAGGSLIISVRYINLPPSHMTANLFSAIQNVWNRIPFRSITRVQKAIILSLAVGVALVLLDPPTESVSTSGIRTTQLRPRVLRPIRLRPRSGQVGSSYSRTDGSATLVRIVGITVIASTLFIAVAPRKKEVE